MVSHIVIFMPVSVDLVFSFVSIINLREKVVELNEKLKENSVGFVFILISSSFSNYFVYIRAK